MNNINDSYFDGYYKDIWRSIIPEVLTRREVEFIIQYFNLVPGDAVLDLMCGYGRHTLALAREGIQVTAVDNLPHYAEEIVREAAASQLPVTVITGSVISAPVTGHYKLAVCMGNSLNFFPPEQLQPLLKRVAGWLVPGGHFLVNSWSLTEIAVPAFREHSDQQIGEYRFINESRMLQDPPRIEINTTIIPASGEPENRTAVDYLYTLDELKTTLSDAGLVPEAVFSIPGKKYFTAGEPRAYIVARKS